MSEQPRFKKGDLVRVVDDGGGSLFKNGDVYPVLGYMHPDSYRGDGHDMLFLDVDNGNLNHHLRHYERRFEPVKLGEEPLPPEPSYEELCGKCGDRYGAHFGIWPDASCNPALGKILSPEERRWVPKVEEDASIDGEQFQDWVDELSKALDTLGGPGGTNYERLPSFFKLEEARRILLNVLTEMQEV